MVTQSDAPIYIVYVLYCANGSYYTGYTTDLKRRYQEHLAGTAKCKYTRSFKPIRIAQCWKVVGDKSTALKLESHIKRLSKAKKETLIANPIYLTKQFVSASII